MTNLRSFSPNRRAKRRAALAVALAMVAMFSSGLLRGSVPAVQTGQWVSGGDMGAAPTGAAVVALADGRLLITGGAGNGVPSNAISIYDPAASAWLTAGQLLLGRSGHAAAALKDGRIVIAGGRTSSGVTGDIEIYDPATGASVQAGQLTVPRVDHAAAMLTDGRVLIVGGSDGLSPLSGAEIFDAGTGQSAGIAAGLSTPRVKATATTLLDGHVLVAGGNDGAADLKTAELFDAVSGTFFPTGAMSTARSGHSAVLLPNNNQVLIAGGASAGAALASAELYADWRDGFSPAGTNMSVPRAGALAGGLQPYSLAFVGGGGPSTGEYYGYATVKTDKDDYWPGEPVTVTGSGWQPGETVTVTITEDADTHNDFTYTAVADNAGNFTNSEFAPIQNAVFQHFGMRFYVKARGAASEALNTFTDGNVTLRLSAAEGVPTMTVSWTRYNGSSSNPNNACSGTDTDSGTLVIAAGGAANIPGFGNNNSVRLTAVASSTPAKTFDRWTSGTATVDSNVVVPGSPTPCIARNLAGTNGNISDVFAHFTSTNAAPAATAQSVATNEDTAKAVTLSGSDPDGNALTFSIVASPSHGTLGAIGTVTCTGTPSSCSATVTYTPAANFNGSDSFSFKVNDGTADSPAATVSITVDPVNDAPTFTKGADQTVPEDAGAQTVPGWATAISAGPSDEAAQTLTFSTTNDNNQLFTVQPTVASNGTLTFTPAADASGSATVTVKLADDGGTANGGVDSSQQTFTITVTPVNDAPSFTKGSDQSVHEDAGAQSVTGWATGISAGPNESTQTVSFQITNNTNAALFSAGPAVDAAGNLTYTAAADANGSATITLVIKDDGGTANGGVDTSAPQTFVIAVTAVNDAPTFTKGADQTVLEDAGAQTVAGWATAISAGPADESTQTLTFTTTNTNNGLFASQPSVAANGTLTYTPAADASGAATVTVRLEDDGGTANGGINFREETFTITVTPVNDAPSFTKGSDQSVNEDAGAQSVTGWATGVSAGPNEGTQTVSFQITNNTNAALFSAGPAVDAAGNLTYTAAADANGSATITLVIKDDGGTANGGVDTSAPQTFVIAVTAVNDAPTFTKGADQTVLEDAGAQTVAGWATAISAGPTDESGQTLTFLTTNSNNALFSSQPTVGANGTLTYTSAQDANGTATVTVRLSDNGGTANGGQDHSDQTFTITITPVNDAPANVMAALSASSIAENQSTTVSGSFTDPDAGDTHAVTIVWGDGSPSTVLNLAAGVFVYSAPHQYLDDNPTGTAADVHSVSVTVTDNGAPPLSGLAAASVTVNNVAPVISALVGPMPPQPLGSNVTVTGTFTDQGTQDTHTCSVTWDDGSTTSGTVTEANGSGTCTASRVFAAPGVYSIDMKITDDDGGFATRRIDSEYVVVFDPSGGFVTGGGWIMSPAGASPMYPTATGKANFGFVSKYKKGSNIPEGQTEFQFKAGDLNFHSSAYDLGSLVVSGGKAQYRGTGTVNGVAGYRFLLIAYDGQGPGGSGVDRFRIKITLGGTVVYDNRMGASEDLDNAYPLEISGGSIDIHR